MVDRKIVCGWKLRIRVMYIWLRRRPKVRIWTTRTRRSKFAPLCPCPSTPIRPACHPRQPLHTLALRQLSGPNNHFINSLHWFQFKTRGGMCARWSLQKGRGGEGAREVKIHIPNYRRYKRPCRNTDEITFFFAFFIIFFLFSALLQPCRTLLSSRRILDYVLLSSIFYLKFFLSCPSFFSFYRIILLRFFLRTPMEQKFLIKIWWIIFCYAILFDVE